MNSNFSDLVSAFIYDRCKVASDWTLYYDCTMVSDFMNIKVGTTFEKVYVDFTSQTIELSKKENDFLTIIYSYNLS